MKQSLWLTGTLLALCCAVAIVQTSSAAQGAGARFGRVTHLEGSATAASSPGGPFVNLLVGRLIRPGQTVKTAEGSRMEITFLDKSVVRLGPLSEYHVEAMEYTGKVRTRFSARLSSGRIWANVRVGTQRRYDFRISTPTAIISVRGTTYDLLTGKDESTEVSVYDGRVGVSPPPIEEGAAHEEISWPEEVTEERWEEIILGKLQRLRIGPDGKPGAPTSFSPVQEGDAWVQWNLARDEAADASR